MFPKNNFYVSGGEAGGGCRFLRFYPKEGLVIGASGPLRSQAGEVEKWLREDKRRPAEGWYRMNEVDGHTVISFALASARGTVLYQGVATEKGTLKFRTMSLINGNVSMAEFDLLEENKA
eukprot:Hpha_TRINITY_DN14509_c0_g1::TRINITY_DN14509_c0_g1_i1::g.47006::m.47006